MKRSYSQKSSICKHSQDSPKKLSLNKTNRSFRKSCTISVKKSIKENDHQQHPYLIKKKKRPSFCIANSNDNDLISKNDTNTICLGTAQEDLVNVEPAYLSTLRHEAYDELHRQMQQYNDSFVIRMQQAEQQRHEVAVQRQSHRRRSIQLQPYQTRRPSLVSSNSSTQTKQNRHNHHHPHYHRPRLHYCQQEESDPGIEELVDMLETGTIKDYSLLTEWEHCQNPQIELAEEHQGGFGDLW